MFMSPLSISKCETDRLHHVLHSGRRKRFSKSRANDLLRPAAPQPDQR